jgi:hypothetical protein
MAPCEKQQRLTNLSRVPDPLCQEETLLNVVDKREG